MQKLLKIGIVAAIALFILYSCGKKILFGSMIKEVKNGYFYEEISDVTIGEIMDTLCTKSKWEYTPDDSGVSYVTYTGKMKGQPVKMMFYVYNAFGTVTFQLNYFSLDGKTAENEILADIPFALYEAYENVKF